MNQQCFHTYTYFDDNTSIFTNNLDPSKPHKTTIQQTKKAKSGLSIKTSMSAMEDFY